MSNTLKARLPRGFVDRQAADLAATHRMLEAIRKTYELYGFEALETPFVEYTEALGKFLPDQDRPNEGVFSFQDDDEAWLSLRYDLTAPLARHVAERLDAQHLTLPYRSYRAGWVFRNEKPGPGRFRQFMQFDADTVGSSSPAADAEMCMMMADTLEAVGLRGKYVVKVNNRKVLDGVMEAIGLGGEENAGRRLTVLRALDKFDRLGVAGVRDLLGEGRKDDSGDVTKGADLLPSEIEQVVAYLHGGLADKQQFRQRTESLLRAGSLGADSIRSLVQASGEDALEEIKSVRAKAGLSDDQIRMLLAIFKPKPEKQIFYSEQGLLYDDDIQDVFVGDTLFEAPITNKAILTNLAEMPVKSVLYREGIAELDELTALARAAGYGSKRIRIDPSVVRGLEYYTGPVFEAELTFPVVNDEGQTVRFGSVAGGGRYDGLVGRFRAEPVPATGFSIGVSRLLAALQHVKSEVVAAGAEAGPVVVLVMDRDRLGDYQSLVARLRQAGIAAEMYLGPSGMKAQMKYADRRRAPCVVIQGSQEKERGEVQIKDLIEGTERASDAASNAEYRAARLAQVSVAEDALVEEVGKVLDRHGLR